MAANTADEALFDALERYGRPDAPRLLRVDVAQVVYLTGQESGVLDADDYLDAEPDPLAEPAERVLAHVNAAHREQLANGVSRHLGRPAGEVWLWELDSRGGHGAGGRLARPLPLPGAHEQRERPGGGAERPALHLRPPPGGLNRDVLLDHDSPLRRSSTARADYHLPL
ncbi:hypothetical protein ACFSTC_32885 [Nonomuraea ferruginea]